MKCVQPIAVQKVYFVIERTLRITGVVLVVDRAIKIQTVRQGSIVPWLPTLLGLV